MQTICQIDEVGAYAGASRQIEDAAPCPRGFVRATVPTVPNGKKAVWIASKWLIVDSTPPAPVPQTVTPRQARLALQQNGLLDTVEAAVAGADKATQITWNYATEVRRDDALLASIAASLGLSNDTVDDLFRLAATFT